MQIDTTHFKKILEEELSLLEKELSTIGRKNPDNPADWEAVEPQDGEEAEEGDLAEGLDEYSNNRGMLNQLEYRYNEVKNALSRIDSEKYGFCEVGGEEIELDRLEANPAATTCKKHMQ